MEPVTDLHHLAVELAATTDGPRVEIINKLALTEVVSLDPGEARLLAMRLMVTAEAARELPPLPGSRPDRS